MGQKTRKCSFLIVLVVLYMSYSSNDKPNVTQINTLQFTNDQILFYCIILQFSFQGKLWFIITIYMTSRSSSVMIGFHPLFA